MRLVEGKELLVVSDFDNTITDADLMDRLVVASLGERGEKVIEKWDGLEIGAVRAHKIMLKEGDLTLEMIDERAEEVKLRKGFDAFSRWCADQGVRLLIVSDGLDRYIERMLAKNKISGVEVCCNKILVGGDGLEIIYPFRATYCDFCGNCKKMFLKSLNHGGFIVYIGDGNSDFCAAQLSDFVLARGQLLEFCKEKGLRHAAFEDFEDVMKLIDRLSDREENQSALC